MGRTELATATGRERLALCVFKAPVGDRLVSMCELNALGLRDRYYDGLREADRRTHTESSNAARSLHAGGEIVEPLRSSRSWPVGWRELVEPPQTEHSGNPSSNGRGR